MGVQIGTRGWLTILTSGNGGIGGCAAEQSLVLPQQQYAALRQRLFETAIGGNYDKCDHPNHLDFGLKPGVSSECVGLQFYASRFTIEFRAGAGGDKAILFCWREL
jgi:hypothetical protein